MQWKDVTVVLSAAYLTLFKRLTFYENLYTYTTLSGLFNGVVKKFKFKLSIKKQTNITYKQNWLYIFNNNN
jgi:hypothetical protein